MQQIRRIAMVLGVLAGSVAATGIATHYVGAVSTTVARIAAFVPVLVVLAAVAVVLLTVARRWVLAALAAGVLAVGVYSQVPLFTGMHVGPAKTGDVTVRLMQANIRLGEADADALVRTVTNERVDVLTVIELTPHAVERLTVAGIGHQLPYSFLRAREGGGGAGIFSRFPLSEGVRLDGFELDNLQAVADIPGVGNTAVYALHPMPPYPGPASAWAIELRRLRGIFAAQIRPMIVGADFNSTYDHRQFRDLLRNASPDGRHPVVDAAEYLGAGIVATYPAGGRLPALLAIDKILARGGTPVSLHRVDLPGSDHHGVIGEIRFGAAG